MNAEFHEDPRLPAATSDILAERWLREAARCEVLVIDDDEGIRTALAEALETCGYEVVLAADGQEGMQLLEVGFQPKAIVLDLMMPRMDGWSFLRRVRSDPRFREMPVVVTSAFTDEAPLDADSCLQKPFDVAQLDREVARLCGH